MFGLDTDLWPTSLDNLIKAQDTRLETLDYYPPPILEESFSPTNCSFQITNYSFLSSFEIRHTEPLSSKGFLVDYMVQSYSKLT